VYVTVKGHRDFPVGGQLISLRVDRLCPRSRSADLHAVQHALASQQVGLSGAVLELGLDRQGGVEGERGDGGEQQLADGGVDLGASYVRAAWSGVFDAGALAQVLGQKKVRALIAVW
jgi:hypothetical protein